MPRRVLEGTVVSTKMDKTITVLVERRMMHPIYKKYLRMTKKYAAHDEHGAAKEGDKVQIMECAPISKRKNWTLLVDGAVVTTKADKPVAAAPKKEGVAKKPAAAKKKPAAKKTAKKA